MYRTKNRTHHEVRFLGLTTVRLVPCVPTIRFIAARWLTEGAGVMKLFLATKLTLEECTERLHNAIDPIPTTEERLNTTPNTSWSPDPLPAAGRRTTGFGYSPGTRPVVGTIEDNTFHLEKLIVQSGNR